MKYPINILNHYIEKGLVVKNDHPTLPISIYNYSRTCQYESAWDEVTRDCRGLILDNDGNVVAKSFPKFFNMEEHKPEQIPNEPFEVFEKLDGSLGILFYYEKELTFEERTKLMDATNGPWDSFGDITVEMDRQKIPTKKGEWILATKGSFISEQAIRGMEILKRYKYERLIKGFTYLFEIIYPENRIVCNYDFEDLILLAVIDNKDGYEMNIHDEGIHLDGIRYRNLYANLGFKMVKKYDGINDYNTLKSLISKDREGYVIRFKNGFRMKIKGEEYVRLHRILTGFSNVDIWEYLKDGKDLNELLYRVPDEFDVWVKETVRDLVVRYENVEKEYTWIFDHTLRVENSNDRKVFAEFAKRYNHPSILFSMLDRRSYSDYIWKIIKPKYSKPFWQKETE